MSTSRDDVRLLSDLQYEYNTNVNDVVDFITESAQKRVDAIRSPEISVVNEAIAAEIALAAGLKRLDIIQFLMDRLFMLSQLEAEIKSVESRVYQETFGDTEKDKL